MSLPDTSGKQGIWDLSHQKGEKEYVERPSANGAQEVQRKKEGARNV